MAAVSLAKRVAQELQVPVGGLVGYTVRFEDRSTSWNTTLSRVDSSANASNASNASNSSNAAVATRIHFVTDGMLLRFLVSDELLLGCSFLILDEVHGRSVRTDILFGLVKQIMRVRNNSAGSRRSSNPLKLVIMSATMNAQKFASFFNNNNNDDDDDSSLSTKILYVPGRQFPVQIYYTPTPVPNYVDATITTILQIHQSDPSATVIPKVEAAKVLNAECMTSDWNSTSVASHVSSSSSSSSSNSNSKSSSSSTNSGDVLVFLTGQEEIESCASILKECARTNPHICSSLLICPLYASMPSHQQAAVFDATPAGMRKIVLATNVAETSITIPGIRHVIDCGLAKTRGYNARVGMESLSVQPVSRAAARQRSGRAGRESPGTTYRLYTEDCYWSDLEEDSVPEILRCALSTVILMLKAIKINSKRCSGSSGSSKRIKDAEEDDIFDFPFLDRPPLDALKKALAELYLVNALDVNGALTKLGRQMALFPLEPKLSRVLLASLESGVSAEVISIIALLSVENIFIFSNNSHQDQDDDGDNGRFMQARQKFSSPFGDHLTLLNVLAAYEDHNNNNGNSASTAGKQTYRIVESKRDWCARHLIHHKSMQQVVQVKQQLCDLVSHSQ